MYENTEERIRKERAAAKSAYLEGTAHVGTPYLTEAIYAALKESEPVVTSYDQALYNCSPALLGLLINAVPSRAGGEGAYLYGYTNTHWVWRIRDLEGGYWFNIKKIGEAAPSTGYKHLSTVMTLKDITTITPLIGVPEAT